MGLGTSGGRQLAYVMNFLGGGAVLSSEPRVADRKTQVRMGGKVKRGKGRVTVRHCVVLTQVEGESLFDYHKIPRQQNFPSRQGRRPGSVVRVQQPTWKGQGDRETIPPAERCMYPPLSAHLKIGRCYYYERRVRVAWKPLTPHRFFVFLGSGVRGAFELGIVFFEDKGCWF